MPIPALLAAAPGLIQAGASLFGGGKRRREQRIAQQQFDADSAAVRNFQFSNPYADQENTAEDLTVNQQAAQFGAQQTDAGLAQGLDQFVQSGGGGGGAQSFAQASLQAKQGAAADIARQEQGNQALRAQQAALNQRLEAQGDARPTDSAVWTSESEFKSITATLRSCQCCSSASNSSTNLWTRFSDWIFRRSWRIR